MVVAWWTRFWSEDPPGPWAGSDRGSIPGPGVPSSPGSGQCPLESRPPPLSHRRVRSRGRTRVDVGSPSSGSSPNPESSTDHPTFRLAPGPRPSRRPYERGPRYSTTGRDEVWGCRSRISPLYPTVSRGWGFPVPSGSVEGEGRDPIP